MVRGIKVGAFLVLGTLLTGCAHVIPGWTQGGLAAVFVASTVPKEKKPDPYPGVLTEIQRSLNAEDSYSLGEVYYQSGVEKNYRVAFELFLQAAGMNHPRAKARLGWMLLDGIGGPKNVIAGLEWLEQANTVQDDEVSIILGNLYLNGDEGVERNLTKSKKYYQDVLQRDKENVDAMIGIGRVYEIEWAQDATGRDKAIKWYTQASKLGSIEAKYRLASLYASGPENTRNYEQSVKLYKEVALSQQESAYHGDASALVQLGDLYEAGLGVPQNSTKAAQFYEAAAQDGSARAAFSLGTIYEFSDGHLRDFRKAYKWYDKAVELGYVYAAYRIGLLFEYGKGVAKDLKEANKYYKLAAKGGILPAYAKLADHYLIGRGLPRNPQRAAEYYYKLAAKNDPFAQYMLSNLFRYGIGVKKDIQASVAWKFKGDAQTANGYAKTKVAEFFFYGHGVLQSYDDAFYWFRQAADQGVPKAQWMMGEHYYNGYNAKVDYLVAFPWYQKAAEQGYAPAKYAIAVMTYNGQGTDKDKNKAAEHMRDAADQGVLHAQYRLAQMYNDGDGVPQSDVEAYAWWALSEGEQFEGVKKAIKLIDKMRPEEQDKAIKLAIKYRREYMGDTLSN